MQHLIYKANSSSNLQEIIRNFARFYFCPIFFYWNRFQWKLWAGRYVLLISTPKLYPKMHFVNQIRGSLPTFLNPQKELFCPFGCGLFFLIIFYFIYLYNVNNTDSQSYQDLLTTLFLLLPETFISVNHFKTSKWTLVYHLSKTSLFLSR